MFNSGQTLRVIFSVVSMALILASTAIAQDKLSVPLSPLDAVMSSILKQNMVGVPKEPAEAGVGQESLIDFTRPRLMNPVGLIPAPDREAGVKASNGNRTASGALRITLEEAQARAVSLPALSLAGNMVDAARYHRQAAQADYFPKVGAFLVNLHFNKFMGDTIQLFRRGIIFPTVSRAVPIFDKDQTYVGPTVTQPLTPLFKVHEAVRIARADERIARAKANAVSTQLVADVDRAYFELLIAQRRQTEAEANVEIAERKLQIASATTTHPDGLGGMMERETALLEARKALVAASDKVTELTNSFIDLTGFPDDARLELLPPPPVVIQTTPPTQKTQKPQPAIVYNPEIVEAEETVVKARAAHRLAKLEYVPDAVITGGYMFQTGIPALPDDFSWIGVIATWTIFDFGKRERTIKERGAQVAMARANLQLVRAKAAAGAQKTVMDLDRTRRILELTRQVVTMQRAAMPRDQDPGPEARAALAKAEAEMFQADLDYRAAYAQLKRVAGEQ
ncbi:MAG TPA: TolC family protein [Blastocatellia bacterium]|nr:TolC family protein [Blastocatellia bacterium]